MTEESSELARKHLKDTRVCAGDSSKSKRGQQESKISLTHDAFYSADPFWQWAILLGMGATALLANASEAFLAQYFPTMALDVRRFFGLSTLRLIWHTAVGLHAGEAIVALFICLYRGWYSPGNIFKWTASTLIYGVASLSKLLQHGGASEDLYRKRAGLKPY